MILRDGRWWRAAAAIALLLLVGCTTITDTYRELMPIGGLPKSTVVSINAFDAKNDSDQATPLEYGTGILYENDSVITAAHVVDAPSVRLVVELEGRSVGAVVAGVDPVTDIAVLKLDEPLHSVRWIISKARPGDEVYAYGNADNEGIHVTRGLLSYEGWSSVNDSIPIIKGDLNVWGGFSGGPILDRSGRLVGIITARTAGTESIAIGVRSNTLMPVAEMLRATGGSVWESTGLSVLEDRRDDLEVVFDRPAGLRIVGTTITPETSEWIKASLLENEPCDEDSGGTYLTKVAGEVVRTVADARQLIDRHRTGGEVEIEVSLPSGEARVEMWPLSAIADTPYLTSWSCGD